MQPDAGDDGSLSYYRQYSVYDDCGRADLFMPWSAALVLMANVDHADAALRFLLEHRMFDTFGLVDSAKWRTGAAEPYSVTSRHDFWNTGLSTNGSAGVARSAQRIGQVVFPVAGSSGRAGSRVSAGSRTEAAGRDNSRWSRRAAARGNACFPGLFMSPH